MSGTPVTRLVLPRIRWGWVLVGLAALVFLYSARAVLGPFLAGFVIAYLLNPLTDRLEARGIKRWIATTVVLGTFLAAAGGLMAATAPVVVHQFEALIVNLPVVAAELQPWLADLSGRVGSRLEPAAITGDLAQRAIAWLTGSLGAIIAGGFAFFNIITLVVVAPVVAFYLLRDWHGVVERLAAWWPRRWDPTIRMLLGRSDEALSGFVRGQFLVCCCLAALYMLGWGLIGLDYFVVLALLAGLLGFVPFVGPLIGVGLSVLVAIGQFGLDLTQIGLVVGTFVVVQGIEGSVLTPNLIGNRIGLHPVWVLFAVFAGGEMAGIVGIFLSVPVAAVLGVVARWLLDQYMATHFYADPPPK
jgi:predicted PurR-regulated permease PerM